MTKKDLVKIIKEVVRIEVKKQVREIFIKEEKSTSLKSLAKKEFKEPIRKKYKKREKVNYTSNLNDIVILILAPLQNCTGKINQGIILSGEINVDCPKTPQLRPH